MKARILLALILVAGLCHAQDAPDPLLNRLAKVDIFAFGGVGYAGVRSRGEAAYRLVLARSSALADFEKLLTSGTLEARLYALAGIRTLDLKEFSKVTGPLRVSGENVTVENGCIVHREPFNVALKRIEMGAYDVYRSSLETNSQ